MSTVKTVSESITEMAELTRAGQVRDAAKLARQLVKTATVRELWLIHMLEKELKDRPRTAAAVFQHYYDTAPTDTDRAVVLAFMAYGDKQPRRQADTGQREAQYNGRGTYQGPSRVTTERRAEVRRARRSRKKSHEAQMDADFKQASAGTVGVALDRDERTHTTEVYASGFDYDHAALYRTSVELPCLSGCGLRERNDVNAERVKAGHGDDGLCRECREDGRPGIAPLPVGHTMRDAIHARCAFIFEGQDDAFAGLLALRSAFKASRNANTQALIAEWVGTNLPDEEGRAEAPAGLCIGCGEHAARRNGVCTDELCEEFAAELAAEEAAAQAAAEPEQAKTAGYRRHVAPKRKRHKKADARTKRPANR